MRKVVVILIILFFVAGLSRVIGYDFKSFFKFCIDLTLASLVFQALSAKIKKQNFFICVILLSYVILYTTLSFFSVSSVVYWKNFLTEIKPILHLIMLSIVFGSTAKPQLMSKSLGHLINSLVLVFFVFYFYFALIGETRANMYILREQNFELILIVIIYLIINKKYYLFSKIIPGIILLAGSRSAFLSMMPILMRKINIQTVFFTLILLSMFTFLFFDRVSNYENIDRISFAIRFLSDIKDVDLITIFFGQMQFTPLNVISPTTCEVLIRYDQFYDGSGNCYSPILHAELLRLVANYGIIGAIVIYSIFYALLTNSFEKDIATALIIVFLLCSLGISALGNSIAVIAVILTYRIRQNVAK